MKNSETVTSILPAMVKAQSEVKNLYPGAKGYGYNYVPLEAIVDHLRDVLPEFGLAYIQLPTGGDGNNVGLTTRIIHESGEWIEEKALFPITDMKGVNKSQASGAALTYFRRYALSAAFGITGDADVDASDKAMSHADYAADIVALETCGSLDQLKSVYEATHKKYHGKVPREVIEAKDELKRKLS